MGVVTVSATQISNADSGIANNARAYRAVMEEAVGSVELANGDSIGSVYRLCRVPSNARIARVLLSCDAITSGAADIGLAHIAKNGSSQTINGNAQNAFFASAVSIATALVHSDVTHEADPTDSNANDFGLADAAKALWEVLGYSTDPCVEYDVTATLTAATTAAGTLNLNVGFCI